MATKKKLRRPTKKRATKKATKTTKVAKKAKAPRTPKSSTPLVKVRRTRFNELRRTAGQDYIMDPDQRSIEFWHGHPERTYKDIAFRTFREWAYNDGWTTKRDHLWSDLEYRVYEATKEALLEQRMREIEARTEERDAMSEYISPMRDADGEIRRYPAEIVEADGTKRPHPFGGLAVMPLPFKDMGDAVRAFVKLDQHLMTLRGEVTSRTEHISRSDPAKAGMLIDPVAAVEDAISDDDIHAMSRALLRQRQPELALEAEFSLVEEEDDV